MKMYLSGKRHTKGHTNRIYMSGKRKIPVACSTLFLEWFIFKCMKISTCGNVLTHTAVKKRIH